MLIQKVSEEFSASSEFSMFSLVKEISTNKKHIAKILALCSFKNREDAMDEYYTEERTSVIKKVKNSDALNLIMILSNWNKDYEDFMRYFGLDKERERLTKINNAKQQKSSDSTTITLNGKSIYGTLIDVACERYGWTFDYVVWGISLLNLNMLLADHITSLFLTKDEKKLCGASADSNVISLKDLRNLKNAKDLINKL